MRSGITTMIVVAFAAAACAEPADNTTDDVDVDTVSFESPDPTPVPGSPPAEGDVPDGDGSGSDASDDGAAAATIPVAFRGEWNADRSACGTGASETRLRIGADRIRFYESVGAVRAVDVVSDHVVVVSAEYQGEGDTWQEDRRLTLAQDGSSLTVSGGGDLVRYRCP